MRTLTRLSALLALTLCGLSHANPQIAAGFVVGQSTYSRLAPITGAAEDARLVASSLTTQGTKVVSGTNLTRVEWNAKLREFQQAVAQAETAVFYFSGHSLSINGKNYLIPVDAKLEDLKNPAEHLIDTSELLSIFKSVRQTLIVWDGCWLLSRTEIKGSIVNNVPCADPLLLLAPRSVSVTRSSVRGLQLVDAGNSTFGVAAAEALGTGLGPVLTAAVRIQEAHFALDRSIPPLSSTLLPGDAGAASALGGDPEAAAKAVAEAADTIVLQLSETQLAPYADVPAIVAGLRASFDRNAPAPAEDTVQIAARLMPQLVKAGLTPDPATLADYRQPYSFGLGRKLGQQLQQRGVRRLPDVAALGAGIESRLAALVPSPAAESAPAADTPPSRDAAVARAEGEKMLAAAASRPGALRSPSGLVYEVTQPGTGKLPLPSGTVQLHLITTLADGQAVEDTRAAGTPKKVAVNSLPAGMQEGLLLMREGARLKLYIPSDIAFGPTGNERIGPNESLMVDIELLKVE